VEQRQRELTQGLQFVVRIVAVHEVRLQDHLHGSNLLLFLLAVTLILVRRVRHLSILHPPYTHNSLHPFLSEGIDTPTQIVNRCGAQIGYQADKLCQAAMTNILPFVCVLGEGRREGPVGSSEDPCMVEWRWMVGSIHAGVAPVR
jgi:hypothetical protein